MKWVVYCISMPLLFVAYLLEAIGYYQLPATIYRVTANMGFAMGMHHLGSLLCDLEWKDSNIDEGKRWISKAAAMGNKESVEWLSKYDKLSESGKSVAQDLLNYIRPSGFYWTYRKYIWSAYIAFVIYMFVKLFR